MVGVGGRWGQGILCPSHSHPNKDLSLVFPNFQLSNRKWPRQTHYSSRSKVSPTDNTKVKARKGRSDWSEALQTISSWRGSTLLPTKTDATLPHLETLARGSSTSRQAQKAPAGWRFLPLLRYQASHQQQQGGSHPNRPPLPSPTGSGNPATKKKTYTNKLYNSINFIVPFFSLTFCFNSTAPKNFTLICWNVKSFTDHLYQSGQLHNASLTSPKSQQLHTTKFTSLLSIRYTENRIN